MAISAALPTKLDLMAVAASGDATTKLYNYLAEVKTDLEDLSDGTISSDSIVLTGTLTGSGIVGLAASTLTVTSHASQKLQLASNDAVEIISDGLECLKGMGIGGASAVGFNGVTPVIKHATTGDVTGFVAGTGTAVNDDSVFAGAAGSAAYTVGDIVTALKAVGLLTA